MKAELAQLSAKARQAVQHGDWASVNNCANRILKQDSRSAEGHYLSGLAKLVAGHLEQAEKSFNRALHGDPARYDAAIELASLYAKTLRHGLAAALLERYSARLERSPLYLDKAGTAWTRLGLHERAYPLFQRANEIQPGVDILQSNLAACAVFLGKLDEARDIYERLLERAPLHQQHHYQLSRVARAEDDAHVKQMLGVLEQQGLPPERNIFLYYAIGKELEDLERWDESFQYYKMAGDAARNVADYDVARDVELIDTIIASCSADWLAREAPAAGHTPVPIFVTGLPRTGTTLTDRILSAHSSVDSVDETHFLSLAIERAAGTGRPGDMTPRIIERAAAGDVSAISGDYLQRVAHKLGDAPLFVEKLPENFLYLGFIARAWPDARIVCLRRNPLDACFAMYKQSFFRYAYSLDDLGRYYIAHERLYRHWKACLGERLVELRYEDLVADQEGQTRRLLDELGLPFEAACLEFEKNASASATASAAQVREKIHNRSVGKWRRFESHLAPLRDRLEAAGIATG